MRRQLLAAIVLFLSFTVLTGVIYPLVITGVSQVAFPSRADGSLLERDGGIVGSRLIGQQFEGPRYFHSRPSAAGDGYDAMSSSASNLGPTNDELPQGRARAPRRVRGGERGARAGRRLTASGSGLDPQISAGERARPAQRVARERVSTSPRCSGSSTSTRTDARSAFSASRV